MVDLLHLFLHRSDILEWHVLYHDERKTACPELVLHDGLPLHGLKAVRQVAEHIIVRLCAQITDYRRDQQDKCGNQNHESRLNDRPTESVLFLHTLHSHSSLLAGIFHNRPVSIELQHSQPALQVKYPKHYKCK